VHAIGYGVAQELMGRDVAGTTRVHTLRLNRGGSGLLGLPDVLRNYVA